MIYSTIGNSIYSTTNVAVRNYPGIMKYIIDALSHPEARKKIHISLNIHLGGRAPQRQSFPFVYIHANIIYPNK